MFVYNIKENKYSCLVWVPLLKGFHPIQYYKKYLIKTYKPVSWLVFIKGSKVGCF